MTWVADIEECLSKGDGLTFGEWFAMLRRGDATFYCGENMHGSAAVIGGEVVITHLAGRWDDNDAAVMKERLQKFAIFHGMSDGAIFGRRGWKRFLAMRGFKLEG